MKPLDSNTVLDALQDIDLENITEQQMAAISQDLNRIEPSAAERFSTSFTDSMSYDISPHAEVLQSLGWTGLAVVATVIGLYSALALRNHIRSLLDNHQSNA